MPQAVLHILVPLVLMALFKDIYERKTGNRFSLHYVLIAGVAGLLPDIDIIIYWALHWFGFTLDVVHRTFTHNVFFPLIFVALFLIFRKKNFAGWGKNKIRFPVVMLMLAFGFAVHLILDGIFSGSVMLFYPFSFFSVGLDLVGLLPPPLDFMFLPSLDAVLLFLWLIWLELRHKVSDFV